MKLNNKGFAITGILYTLFILFSLILVSVLAGLSSKLRILEKSGDSVLDDYEVSEEITTVDSSITSAVVDGKYVYSGSGEDCYVYLKKGASLTASSLNFTTSSCNTNKSSLSLKGYYSFLGNGS